MKSKIIDPKTYTKEIPRFLVVGSSAVACDFVVYYLLINFFDYSPAKTVSFLSGAVLSYFLNKYWTFEKIEKGRWEVSNFAILNLFTLMANVGVNKLGLFLLPGYVFIAFILATGTSTILNFLGQKLWVFRPDRPC